MSDLSTELKKQLAKSSSSYREDVEDAFHQVVGKLGKTGINVLIISGSLLVSYLLYKGIAGKPATSKSKKKEGENGVDEPGKLETFVDRMAERVVEQTMVFLLQFAKERLLAFLEEVNEESEDDPGETLPK